MQSTLVGMRTGPFTLSCFSLAPRIRSAHTEARRAGSGLGERVCAGGAPPKRHGAPSRSAPSPALPPPPPTHPGPLTLLQVAHVLGGEGDADAVHGRRIGLLHARLGSGLDHGGSGHLRGGGEGGGAAERREQRGMPPSATRCRACDCHPRRSWCTPAGVGVRARAGGLHTSRAPHLRAAAHLDVPESALRGKPVTEGRAGGWARGFKSCERGRGRRAAARKAPAMFPSAPASRRLFLLPPLSSPPAAASAAGRRGGGAEPHGCRGACPRTPQHHPPLEMEDPQLVVDVMGKRGAGEGVATLCPSR